MKMFKLNPRLARGATAALALGLLLGAQTSMACSVENWSLNSGNVSVGGRVADGIERYSGVCAMQTADGAISWVQDESPSPGGISRIVSRFYVLNNLANGETADIYRGFASTSGNSPLFTLTMTDGGQIVLRDEATGATVDQTAPNEWASVVIDWAQGAGAGSISLSVSGLAAETVSSLSNDGSLLQSVRLGNLDGSAGSLNFDAYESRRSTQPELLLIGDVNGNGEITSADIVGARLEFLGTEQPGQPDCNENGSITSADIVCTRLEFLNAP